jgi:peroxin-4
MAAASKRLIKELAEHQNDPNPHLGRLGPVDDDDLMHWTAELLGPRDTPYEGCRWEIDIKISERYPQEPPEMRFKTPCCHPNVHLEVYIFFFFWFCNGGSSGDGKAWDPESRTQITNTTTV